MTSEITYDVKERVHTISTNPNGWSKQLCIISWNGGPYKIDIRDWDEKFEKMSRGITLYEDDAKELMAGLIKYFSKEV